MATNRKKNGKTAHARDRMKKLAKESSERRGATAIDLFEKAADSADDLHDHLAMMAGGDYVTERDAVITALEELMEAAGMVAP